MKVTSQAMKPLPGLTSLVQYIQEARNILLTTHKQCDGDGLGAQLGLFHALKKVGKPVRAICVDAVPPKYSFLDPQEYIEVFEEFHEPIETTDLALIFDTNDKRLVEPLYTELTKKCKKILFIDHHPILNQGPEPTFGSFIDTRAASTGEIAYFLIQKLNIDLDTLIARAIYTSIAFDTQVFKYIRNSSNSHLIAAQLLQYEKEPDKIHRQLFATHTQGKVRFLSKALGEIEFFGEGKAALLCITHQDLKENDLHADDSRDIIDMMMNIRAIEIAVLFRQEKHGHKVSLRSKGKFEVLGIAENFQGGGHIFAAGAFIEGDIQEIIKEFKKQILQRVTGG